MSTKTAAVCSWIVSVLAVATLAQQSDTSRYPGCIPANFWGATFNSTEPSGWFVKPNATCMADGSVSVQFVYNFPSGDGNPSPPSPEEVRVKLFYECTYAGNATVQDEVPASHHKSITAHDLAVMLNESFVEVGAACSIFGCYQPIDLDDPMFFEMENGTCSFTPPELPTTTFVPTLQPTTTMPSNVNTMGPIDVMTSVLPTDMMTTDLLPSATPAVPDGDPNQTHRDQVITVLLVVFFLIAGLSILILIGILLRFRQVQRRKQSMMWFYNYQEPIDPNFNPINFNAPMKRVASIRSVFDTFYHPRPVSDDDDKSEVLQGATLTEDNLSAKSVVFQDDSGVAINSRTSSEEPNKTNASVKDSTPKESSGEKSVVSSVTADNQQSTPVSNGYVIEKTYTPSKVSVQSPVNGDYVRNGDTAHAAPTTLNWNRTEQKQFRAKLNSTSSGYVMDLKTPDHHSYPVSLDSGVIFVSESDVRESSVKSPSQCKYTTLKNGYTVVESQQHLKGEVPCEETLDSVYYNEDLEESSEGEGEVDQQDSENVVTECSLSLNPLHFEPVNYDELMQEQTAPTYVNTSVSVFSTQ